MESNIYSFTAEAIDAGERADQLLARFLAQKIEGGVSRAQVQRLFERGLVKRNGAVDLRPGARVREGDLIEAQFEATRSDDIVPQEIALSILYEDETILCVNKPAGLTVHPGAGQRDGTLLNALAHHLRQSAPIKDGERPWIVHRLDKDTSGVLVIAKTDSAHRALSLQFQERQVEKEYRALVLSTPRLRNAHIAGDSGVIEAAIARHPTQRTRMATSTERGRAATTRWKVIERFEYGTLLGIKIETGRTHQIRVHFESIGAPVIGDKVYGVFQALPKPLFKLHERFGRQALHSFRLELTHPKSGARCSFEAPLPEDMETLIHAWRNYRHG